MTTPFPGVDPYLEDPVIWPDFHTRLLVGISNQLNQKLPEYYVARMDRYVWVDEAEEPPRLLGRPDVDIVDTLNRPETSAKPATLPAFDAQGKPFLRIIDARSKRIITVIELLSPTNKAPGRGRGRYLIKRQEYLRSRVNLVEIGLLRDGERPPLESPRSQGDYYILVSRPADFPQADLWTLRVRDPLPTIPVPLDAGMEPVSHELRACLERAYDEGRFGEEIDYQQPPIPPLPEADATWARELLQQKYKSKN